MTGEKSPLISIIVPSFNEEKNIRRCLDSILNQTWNDFEVICIDDNSTDSTFEIIKEYSVKDNRIKAYKNPHKGVSSARNFGISKAEGSYIGFVDSDDFIQPQMYEFLYRAIKENGCKLAVCRYEKTSEFIEKSFEYNCRECKSEEFIRFYDKDFVEKNELSFAAVWTKLIEKNFALSCEKFQNYRIGEDTLFCTELWLKAEKVFLVDLPLYCYYTNFESVCHSDFKDEKFFDLIETRFLVYEKMKNHLISSFYLDKGIKFLLSYRFIIKGTKIEKNYKKPIKNYFKKYIKIYLKCADISFKNKLFVFVFYLFPFLYEMFRKMTDSTL